MPKVLLRSFLSVIALGLTGCTVHPTETPGLTGPSEFALSFRVRATPDAISQDGESQSSVVVTAFDENGSPKSGVTFRLEMRVAGQPTDYGTLSSRTVVTGSDGRAVVSYTAPPAAPVGAALDTCSPSALNPAAAGPCVTIAAWPTGSNFATAHTETAAIHLIPLSVIIGPTPPTSPGGPVSSFTFSPAAPKVLELVQFSGETSTAGAGRTLVEYQWDFGDGETGTGKLQDHDYVVEGSYTVKLMVVDDQRQTATSSKIVTVKKP